MGTITIIDANGATNEVAEGSASGTATGITTSGSGATGTITWSLTDNDGGNFTIDSASGVVSVANGAALDFESGATRSIEVFATDGNGNVGTQGFNISLIDVAPSKPADSSGAPGGIVSEGALSGATVGITASSSDVNGGAVTYSLTDDAGGRFAINPTTGVVTVADASQLDYESASGHAYSITVKAADPSGLFNTQDFSVAITNLAPPAPTDADGGTNTVAEGAETGTTVGVTANSVDVHGGSVTYALTDDAGGRFSIDAHTGVVTVANGSAIDFETAPSHHYSITVQATDGTNASTTSNFTIGVTDVAPSTPIDTNGTANTIPESSANGTQVHITGFSTDGAGTTSYSLSDNDGGRFAINSTTGVVTVANGALLDFESASSHNITIRANDGTSTVDHTFTINLTNVVPSTPVDTDGSAGGSVSEGAANDALVGITAFSTDGSGSTVYSLTDDADGRFKIDATTGVVSVKDAGAIDYESAPGHAYSVTVQAADLNNAVSQTFSIGVADVAPSTPADTDGSLNQVEEGAANGTLVGIDASSADVNGGTVTYSLADNAGGRFAINATTGVVSVANGALLDFENAESHQITVRASDGTTFTDKNFTINVLDAPLGLKASDDLGPVAENATVVGNVNAPDTDSTGVTYTILPGLDGGFFNIDSHGNLSFKSLPDFEAHADQDGNNIYRVSVVVSDGAGHQQSQTFDVQLTDVAPQLATGNPDTIIEGNTLVGNVNKPGAGDTTGVTYTIINELDASKFTIDSHTGVLSFVSAPDFEHPTDVGGTAGDNQYLVTVAANDGTSPPVTQTYTVAVGNSAAAPSIVDTDAAADSVPENSANGTVVGLTALLTDGAGAATASSVTYSLSDDAGGRFAINAATGVVTVANGSLLDFETAQSQQITVHAVGGAINLTQDFTIDITDVNEAPTTVNGTSHNDKTLNGTSGADIILGKAGNDTIHGLGGNDTIIGGAGKDTLFGDDGSDTFQFKAISNSVVGANRDTIMDFQSGSDLIDLSLIDAKLGTGNQAFTFIGAKPFHDKAGELHVLAKPAGYLVEGDVNGDGKADFQIMVHSATALLVTDFHL